MGNCDSKSIEPNWGYDKHNGPRKWSQFTPVLRGLHQSPINIKRDKTLQVSFVPISVTYDATDATVILNNGHTVQVEMKDRPNSFITGGPVSEKYILKQFHFHWGSKSTKGSEHQVDGKKYAAELHLVHWNSKYLKFDEALSKRDGLIVLAVFIEAGKEHPDLKALTDAFPGIKFPHTSAELTATVNFAQLLPANMERYWVYDGSLTTPPCLEVVKFIVFEDPIQISENQVD